MISVICWAKEKGTITEELAATAQAAALKELRSVDGIAAPVVAEIVGSADENGTGGSCGCGNTNTRDAKSQHRKAEGSYWNASDNR